MFLWTIARPRYDHIRNALFDSKLGIWRFVEVLRAKRNSKNRPTGRSELKPVSVTREIYKKFMMEKVLHTISAHFFVAYK